MDFRLLNGAPKATLIQRFDWSVVLVTPTRERLEFGRLGKAIDYAKENGWEINIEHIRPGPSRV